MYTPINIKTLLFFALLTSSVAAIKNTWLDNHVPPKMEQIIRHKIKTTAQKLINSKYIYAGKTPIGFDCSGLVYFVFKQNHISLPGGSRHQNNYGQPTHLQKAKPGDLLFFRRSPTSPIFHVGILVSNLNKNPVIVHSTSTRGVVQDTLYYTSFWSSQHISVRNVISYQH